MEFFLFSKIQFTITDPIALIESHCIQSNFYSNYDIIDNKKIEDVNKIGARIKKDALIECKPIINKNKNLEIFKHKLDSFLLKLNEKTQNIYIEELCERVIKKLMDINGIRLSTATKILHTLYPKIIPMIDKPLQDEYKNEINKEWNDKEPNQILFDYYRNFKIDINWQNLIQIYNTISERKIINLTKIRIFDILWWSYLKAKKLKKEIGISWSTIKFRDC